MKQITLFLPLVIAALTAQGCASKGSSVAAGGTVSEFSSASVTRQDLQGFVFFDGKMVIPESAQATIFSPTDTTVLSVSTQVGKAVDRGDVIIKLEIAGADAAAAAAKSNVGAAKDEIAAQKNAESEPVIEAKRRLADAEAEERAAREAIAQGGTADLDSAVRNRVAASADLRAAQQEMQLAAAPGRAALRTANENLAAARADAAQGLLRANLSGTVVALDAKAGLVATAKQPLATIVNFGAVRVQGLVPAELKDTVVKDSRVVIALEGQSSDPLDGVVVDVTVIPPTGGQTSPGYLAVIRLVSPTSVIPPVGAVKRIGVRTEKVKNVLVVPVSAVTKKDGRSFVSAKSGEAWTETQVETGVSDGALIEIKSGVSENTVVRVVKVTPPAGSSR